MFNVLIDTCVWLDLADKPQQTPLMDVLDGPAREESYHARIGVRRLGEDTGRDILVNTSGIIAETYEHMRSVLGTSTKKGAW